MDYPNVLIIPEQKENPSDIIEDYSAMIKYNLDRGVPIEDILSDFFDDVNRWTSKQFLIDLAKQSLHELENIHKIETEFIVDDEDEFDEENEN